VGDKKGHYYGEAYQRVFDNFKPTSNINILEVGVQ
jgi:hypothetical protein